MWLHPGRGFCCGRISGCFAISVCYANQGLNICLPKLLLVWRYASRAGFADQSAIYLRATRCERSVLLGTILAIQEALKHFPPTGASVINISSIASENPVPNSTLYSAAKGAIDTITMALSKELGPRNIRVNAVAPA